MGKATKNITTAKGAIEAKPSGAYKDNSATVMYGGNANTTSGPVTQVLDHTTMGYHSGKCGGVPQVPATDATIAAGGETSPTFKPFSGGTFAYQAANNYVIPGVSQTISGAASSVLKFCSMPKLRKSIHKREQVRTLRQSSWNLVTGAAATNTVEVHYAGVSGITDHAARPSRAVPGELTIMETGNSATDSDYSAKTG